MFFIWFSNNCLKINAQFVSTLFKESRYSLAYKRFKLCNVYNNIKKHEPDYIIVNAGGALVPNFESTPIIMDEYQVMSVVQETKEGKVIAIHLDAIDHCATTREVLKAMATKNNISNDKLLIPNDGETIELN